jgi:hypothetical protein
MKPSRVGMISAVIDVLILQNDLPETGKPSGGKRWNYTGNLSGRHRPSKRDICEIR